MDFLKDIGIIHSNAFKKSIKGFAKNWIIIFTGFIYMLINIILFSVINRLFVGVLNILFGFIVAIVTSSLISNYLYLLFNIIKYNGIYLTSFKEGFKVYLWKVYGVFFIGWIASFLLEGLNNIIGTASATFSIVASILLLVIFNPLPETIYQKDYNSFESIGYAFQFMKENWFNWLLPNVVFSFLLYKTTGNIITNLFITHIGYNFDFTLRGFGMYLLSQVLFSFIMIYRGYLFDILSNSTRRKRLYEQKIYN